jgi:periplasmic protein TonB
MFSDTLLESSPHTRRSKRWPMATAFTLEIVIAAVLVIVPLVSTGVIPLPAHAAIFAPPLKEVPLERVKPEPSHSTAHNSAPTAAASETAVILVSDHPSLLYGKRVDTTTNREDAKPGSPDLAKNDFPVELIGKDRGPRVKSGPENGRVVSNLSEGRLINRVEPIYPKPAALAGVQGEVKLHAIVSRNGKIISLNVISGHPLLVQAALDAVSQWRYRPYYLNGEAVEVETFITVNFKREQR